MLDIYNVCKNKVCKYVCLNKIYCTQMFNSSFQGMGWKQSI